MSSADEGQTPGLSHEKSVFQQRAATFGSSLPAALFAAGVVLHGIMLLSLRFGWLNSLFNDSVHRFGPGCDFFSIYAAGVKARLGESVYTIGGHVEAVPYAYAFRYAPIVASTLGAALARLTAPQAYGCWLILCEITLLVNVRLTLLHAPDSRTGLLAASLWLLFAPYYLELYVGQFTLLATSLVFWAALIWLKRERPGTAEEGTGRAAAALAECLFAAAIVLKMFPLLFAPLALLRRRWHGLAIGVVVLAVSSWAYFARFPADVAMFADTNGAPAPSWHAGNQGLMALLYALSGEHLAQYLLLRRCTLAFILAAIGLLIWRAWIEIRRGAAAAPDGDHGDREWIGLYAGLACVYLLGYKDVWEHHYVMLLPALVLMALRRERLILWAPAAAIICLPGLFRLYDVPLLGYNEDPQLYWRPAVSLLHHALKPIGPLWLLGGLCLRALPSARVAALPAARPTLLRLTGAAGLMLLVCFGRWAAAAISEQNALSPQLAWPASVFQMQRRREDCGPAALAAICRHYGIRATEEDIAGLAGTTGLGTSMEGLAAAARQKGLSVQGVEATPEELSKLPLPCLLYYSAGHFAVLTGVRAGRFYLADPSLGQRIWDREMLARHWSRVALLVGPGEASSAH